MTTNANQHTTTTQTTAAATLESKIIQGGLLLGELAAEIETALKSTEAKAMECTKHAYAVGVQHLNDRAGIQALLDASHIKLKNGYSAETHFFAIAKLFAKHAGRSVNSGEISRIGTSCKKVHSDGVGVNDIEAYINRNGGVRAFYNTCKTTKTKPDAIDEVEVDPNLILKVYSGSGFLGILNLDAQAIAKLIATHGLKPTPPTNPSNDNNTPPSPNDGGDAPIDTESDNQDDADANAASNDIEIQTVPAIPQVLNPNAIHLGDCIEFMKSLPDHSVDAIVTSPPYGNQRKAQYGGIDEAEYPAWTVKWMQEAKRILTPKGSVAINIRPHHKDGQISDYTLKTRLAIRESGWREVEELIWDKVGGVPLCSPRLPRRCWESIHWFSLNNRPYSAPKANGNPSNAIGFIGNKGVGTYITAGTGKRTNGIARCTDIVRVPTSACDKSKFNSHPAQYPEPLAAWLIRLLVPEGGVVFDPFMGGGTTAVAAVRNGRQFIGSEMKQEYIDIANRRLAAASPPTNDNTEIQQTQTKEIQHA